MIRVTDEMRVAFRAAQERRATELVAAGAPLGAHDILDQGLAAVLAIVERDQDAIDERDRECWKFGCTLHLGDRPMSDTETYSTEAPNA